MTSSEKHPVEIFPAPAQGAPAVFLRMEAAAALVSAVVAYAAWDGNWSGFALLVMTPDLSLLGYLKGPRLGAWLYNLAHSYTGPAALALLAFAIHSPQIVSLALIWIAHIGLDRLLGFGLKYEAGFSFTHLSIVGRRSGAHARKHLQFSRRDIA